jgi:hypothetical protein
MRNLASIVAVMVWFALVSVSVIGQNKEKVTCNALFPIEDEKGTMGYINYKGEIIVKPQFISALDFHDGVGVVWISDEETGYVDLQGKLTALPGIIIVGGRFSEGLALAEREGQYQYFIDKSGRTVFKLPEYHPNNVFFFSEGLVPVETKGMFYFFNKKGDIAIQRGFGDPSEFVDGMATVLVNEGWAVIDRQGNYILPPREKGISKPSEGMVNMEKNNNSTIFFDKTGKMVLRVPYRSVGNFSEGLSWFIQNGKWGFIDKTGKIVIKPNFDGANNFSDGLAAVEINGKFGFINRKGEIVIPPQFEFVDASFRCGLAYVQKDRHKGYIDKKGQWVWKKRIFPK